MSVLDSGLNTIQAGQPSLRSSLMGNSWEE